MGPQLEYLETILTCKGNFYSPDFSTHLDDLKCRLQELVSSDSENKLVVKKVEPWNSVRVTLTMPANAAHKLKKLAEQKDRILHEIGILEVQIEGGKVISLTINGSKSDVLDQSSAENIKNSENTTEAPSSSSSGQCVPSNETLKSFTSLPQSVNLDWPHSSKVLHLDPGPLSKADIGPSKKRPLSSTDSPMLASNLQTGLTNCSSSGTLVSCAYQNVTSSTEYCSSSLHEFGAQQTGKTWVLGDEKLINCQNIASSSPLLVNLLKSPGNRTQLSSSISVQAHASCELSSNVAVPTQKRKRNQTRKSKRLKEGIETTGLLTNSGFYNQSSDQSIPGTSLTFQYDATGTYSSNIANQTSTSESRQMINPYTGDLEVIDENDESPHTTSTDISNYPKDYCAKSCLSKEPSGMQNSSICNFDANIAKILEHKLTSISDATASQQPISSQPLIDPPSFYNGMTKPIRNLSFLDSNIIPETLIGPTLQQASFSSQGLSTNTLRNISQSFYNINNHPGQHNSNFTLQQSSISPNTSITSDNFLVNNQLSSCYMQGILKVLSSENKTKLLTSQSLFIQTALNRNQDIPKTIIDPNSLAKIIVQSSMLPNALTNLRNINPSLDSKSTHFPPRCAFVTPSGQLSQPVTNNSNVSFIESSTIPADVKSSNLLSFKEGHHTPPTKLMTHKQKSESNVKLNTLFVPQTTQLMFPQLSVIKSSPAGDATPIFNGHPDVLPQDRPDFKASKTDFLSSEPRKNVLPCPFECRMANGCFNFTSTSAHSLSLNSTMNIMNNSSFTTQSPNSNLLSSENESNSSETKASHSATFSSKFLTSKKPLKNTEEILPQKSKTNLTVAQLLEQVEIAKNHLAFANSTSQKDTMCENIYSSSVQISNENKMTSCISKGASLHSTSHIQKLQINSRSTSYSILNSLPMPITSPGYPHNLTESVQKAMQGVEFDTSPPPSPHVNMQLASKRSAMSLHQHPSIDLTRYLPGDKNLLKPPVFVSNNSRDQPTCYTNFDILENPYELSQLEEAFKSTLREHDGLSNDEIETEGSCQNIDLDGNDLEFVFDAEDVSQLDSIIALKDYDDIEKLAETLASNIDVGNIDEEILISENDLESMNPENLDCGDIKNDFQFTTADFTTDSSNAEIPDDQEGNKEQVDASGVFQQCNETDSKPEAERRDCSTSKSSVNRVRESGSQIPATHNVQRNTETCDGKDKWKTVALNNGVSVSQPSCPSRMATRSSNKQKSRVSLGSTSNHVESLPDAQIVLMSSSDFTKRAPEDSSTPMPRRSNRTIRKTELAVELMQSKSVEKSRRTRDDGNVKEVNDSNKLASKCQPASSTKPEQSIKAYRCKANQKRKYNHKGVINENIQNTTDESNKELTPTKKVVLESGNATSPGSLDSLIIEADFASCHKKQKTS